MAIKSTMYKYNSTIIKITVLVTLIVSNAVFQQMYTSYCKKNLIVYFLMRDAAMCTYLRTFKQFTEDIGISFLEKAIVNIVPKIWILNIYILISIYFNGVTFYRSGMDKDHGGRFVATIWSRWFSYKDRQLHSHSVKNKSQIVDIYIVIFEPYSGYVNKERTTIPS